MDNEAKQEFIANLRKVLGAIPGAKPAQAEQLYAQEKKRREDEEKADPMYGLDFNSNWLIPTAIPEEEVTVQIPEAYPTTIDNSWAEVYMDNPYAVMSPEDVVRYLTPRETKKLNTQINTPLFIATLRTLLGEGLA